MKTFFLYAFICVFLTSLGVSLTAIAQQDETLSADQLDYPGSPEKPLTKEIISQLRILNSSGQILEAWKVLARQKDGYAKSASRIFGQKITIEKCVVESNWKTVVGEEITKTLYLPYGQLYQRYYIDFLETEWRYPNTLDIEKLYQRADDDLGLPQSASPDLMLNVVPTDWKRRIFFDQFSSAVGVGRKGEPKLWYHYTKISPARVSAEFITAQDINQAQAKRIYKKVAGKVAKCMAKRLIPSAPVEARDLHE